MMLIHWIAFSIIFKFDFIESDTIRYGIEHVPTIFVRIMEKSRGQMIWYSSPLTVGNMSPVPTYLRLFILTTVLLEYTSMLRNRFHESELFKKCLKVFFHFTIILPKRQSHSLDIRSGLSIHTVYANLLYELDPLHRILGWVNSQYSLA